MNDFKRYSELYHFGIKGMKWGVRRYQNPDGSLTEAGKKKYFNPDGTLTRAGNHKIRKDFGTSKSRTAAKFGASVLAAKVGKSIMTGGRAAKNAEIVKATSILQKSLDHMPKFKSFEMKDAFGQHLMSFAKQNPKYVNAMAKATKGRRVEVAGAAIMGAAAITGAITLHNYYRNKNRQQRNSIQYIDHMRTGKMPINKSDTSVTKKVKSDYNKLSDQEFLNKYYSRKEKYLKNVNKYGDPYRANTLGRALNKKQKSSFKKRKKR